MSDVAVRKACVMKMKSLTAIAGILIVALGASAQQSSVLQDGQTLPLWSVARCLERWAPRKRTFPQSRSSCHDQWCRPLQRSSFVRVVHILGWRRITKDARSQTISTRLVLRRSSCDTGLDLDTIIRLSWATRNGPSGLLRIRAAQWQLDPARIGIMGFSAGGHLAMSASTIFDAGAAGAADAVDRAVSRPDFAILGYPVISMVEPWTHPLSRTNLLGENPDPVLARKLSGEQE